MENTNQNQQINIANLTDTELKALAFDVLNILTIAQNNTKVIGDEFKRRSDQQPVVGSPLDNSKRVG